jgi:hypothetical protein
MASTDWLPAQRLSCTVACALFLLADTVVEVSPAYVLVMFVLGRTGGITYLSGDTLCRRKKYWVKITPVATLCLLGRLNRDTSASQLAPGQSSGKTLVIFRWFSLSWKVGKFPANISDNHFSMIVFPRDLPGICPGKLRKLCTIVR